MAEEETGVLGRLPFLAVGAGPPLVYLAGLTPDPGVPDGASRRAELSTLRPFAARRRVHYINRRGDPVSYTHLTLPTILLV